MTTQPNTSPRRVRKDGDTGRCQHCQQQRPLFKHEGELHDWGFNPDNAAWLCARDHSARQLAIESGDDIRIEHDLIVWPENEPKVRYFPAGRCYDDASGIYRGEDFGPCLEPAGHDGPHVDTDDNRWMRAEEAAAVSSGSGGSRADGNAS